MGGTLTKYAAEGHDVYVVTATRGEAGEIAEIDLATKANLPDVREDELRCACRIYGVNPPILLNYQDGQLTTVHQGQAVGKLVRLLRQLRPQVVVTFGPEGIYGHYDHIAVHGWTTIAVKLAADRSCFPDQRPDRCETHIVQKLYYNVLPARLNRDFQVSDAGDAQFLPQQTDRLRAHAGNGLHLEQARWYLLFKPLLIGQMARGQQLVNLFGQRLAHAGDVGQPALALIVAKVSKMSIFR